MRRLWSWLRRVFGRKQKIVVPIGPCATTESVDRIMKEFCEHMAREYERTCNDAHPYQTWWQERPRGKQ